MGYIIDSKRMHIKYEGLLNQIYFVDKSNIINEFNKLINIENSKYVCITKPRRFGKTSIAAMLVTYYSKGIDSNEIFDKFKASKGISTDETEKQLEIKQYEEYQGKYHTLYFDFSYRVSQFKTLKEYLDSINMYLKDDIMELFPESSVINNFKNSIYENLEMINMKTNEKFIIFIDEWDYIISNSKFTYEERKEYLSFIKDLIKDQPYIAFVYMTGITPITKELSQTTINCFDEYSMLNDKVYYQYFGFTEEEIKELCNKNNNIKYEDLYNWYNGYKSYNGEPIFNTWSVIKALQHNSIENYWTNSGRYDEIIEIINFNINGVKDEILELIKGKEISITLEVYGAEDILKENEKRKKSNDAMKKELYAKMVTFGYLTYCDGKISIPNEELKEKFIVSLSNKEGMKFYYDLIENSRKMLEMTFKKNTKEMCKILKEVHMNIIKPEDKMDHDNLKRVIDHVYFMAIITHDIKEEEGNGKEKLDILFYPKMGNRESGTIIIIKLKVNQSAKKAIEQIHGKIYYYSLKDKKYIENILLIGINCETKEKQYTCEIEEYNSVDELINKIEKKRKNIPEVDSDDKHKKIKKL